VLVSPFQHTGTAPIGEIWFESPAQLDSLLIKYIFTSENLSIQVHPSNAQTVAKGLGRQGKEECWLVIDAEPGARLAIGFNKPVSAAEIEIAARDGSIEALLAWHPVGAGDFFYIPANTVHTIGAGISLIEIQQNSDITYRLYDYGRPRDLHIQTAVEVADGRPYDKAALYRSVAEDETISLVDGPDFRLDQVKGTPDAALRACYAQGGLLVIPKIGSISIAGEHAAMGSCVFASSITDVHFDANSVALLVQPVES
jgi:mannose-6-phosphate isomerase